MKKVWIVLLATSRTVLLSAAGLLLVAGLMFYRLHTLTPGLNDVELATYQSANNLSVITDNLVNAPYKAAVFLSTQVFDSAFGLRLVGASIGILTVVLFYLLIRRILGSIVAIVTTAMFASSSLLLGTARLASPDVMLLSLLAVVTVGFYIRFGSRTDIGWLVAAAVLGLTLYVPGMIFFLIPAAIWQFRHVKKSFERLKTPFVIASSIIFGLLCIPLIVSLVREPALWRDYLGFGASFAPLIEMVKHVGSAITSLFLLSPTDSVHWLGRQPVLDVFAAVMFVYGLSAVVKQYRLDRLWMLFGIFTISLVWVGVTTNRYGIVLLLPFLYIVIGMGIQRFINQWFSVFPKNPIARTTGAALLAVAICLSLNFQLHRYFVAWPNNDHTKHAFQQQLR